ncbi:hypothetical protein ACFSUJ_00230 [Streptomyces lusitanus]|uniref:Uncharacterized protein n=1 Tax=Streptomyces lusitanus TaxID=68232 RepID=A0ABU3K0F6_9ACTN|nr:hypothetical protein [Streptomyces lusitanus]
MRLRTLTGSDAREDSAEDVLVLEGHTGATATAAGVRAWAGRAQEAFYADLDLLAVVNGAVRKGTAVDLTSWTLGTHGTPSPGPRWSRPSAPRPTRQATDEPSPDDSSPMSCRT